MTSGVRVVDAPLHLLDEPLPAGELAPSVMEAVAFPDDTAAWASTTTPGAQTLLSLSAITTGSLSAAGQIDALHALKRQQSWLAAQELRLLGEITRTRRDVLGKNYLHDEVGAACGVSPLSAASRMSFARALLRHPRLLAAMDAGALTEMHAKVFVDETHALDDSDAAAVEDRVLARSAAGTVGEFRKSVRRVVLTVAAKTAEDRHLEARGQRTVEWQVLPDGMEGTWATLPAEISAAIRAQVQAEVAKIPAGDPRTADQRRADAFANLILNGSSTGGVPLPSRHGLHPGVQVTLAASTALGIDDRPGELAGYGPIPASLARQIASDQTGTWRRITTDELGRLVDYGRSTYRPPAPLARHVIGRDVTCCFPDCARPAVICEIDHTLEWDLGGSTKVENLVALCSRHHHLKHDTTWQYDLRDDGSVVWTSPTGHTYSRPAATYPVDALDWRKPAPKKPDPPPKKREPRPLPEDPPF
jgi:hypothetical protein